MKKLAILLTLGFLLTLAGCGQKTSKDDAANASSEKSTSSQSVSSGQTSVSSSIGTTQSTGTSTTQTQTGGSDKIVSQLQEIEGVLNNLDDVPSSGMDIPTP